MQAIVTKYLNATASKQSRIKATSWLGSVTQPFDHALSVKQNHEAAAQHLVDEMNRCDLYAFQKWEIVAIGDNPKQDGYTAIVSVVEVKK